ncbi:MAG: hypothetical protein KC457_20200, partial [Myxococcales bacterium]|nr:hypothetical protein [Myxococcales bacterium]
MTENPVDAPTGAWHPLARVLFRFALVYFLTYALVPELVWDPIVRGLGAALDVPVRYRPNGSGDTTYNQLQVLFGLGLALAASLVWSLIDRRTAHPRLAEALLIAARTYLAVMMLAYGFAKIIGSQFPAPGLELLVRPYGQLSPKGLVWGFMGQSLAYQIFTGLL